MSTHVPPSGAEASSGPVRDERLQALCDRSPTPALAECRPGLCPWCVVGGQHGDLRHALTVIDMRRAMLIDAEDSGLWILAYCRQWLLQLAQADAAGTLRPLPSDASSNGLPPNPFSIFQPADAIPATGTPAAVPAGTLVPPPPPPVTSAPQTPSAWLAAGVPMAAPGKSSSSSGERRGDSKARVLNPPPLLPPPPGPSMASSPRDYEIWEVWGGKHTYWVPYSRSVCLALSRMAKQGPRRRDFVIDGKSYTIDVVALQQDNQATGFPPRQIRKRPHDEVEM